MNLQEQTKMQLNRYKRNIEMAKLEISTNELEIKKLQLENSDHLETIEANENMLKYITELEIKNV